MRGGERAGFHLEANFRPEFRDVWGFSWRGDCEQWGLGRDGGGFGFGVEVVRCCGEGGREVGGMMGGLIFMIDIMVVDFRVYVGWWSV